MTSAMNGHERDGFSTGGAEPTLHLLGHLHKLGCNESLRLQVHNALSTIIIRLTASSFWPTAIIFKKCAGQTWHKHYTIAGESYTQKKTDPAVHWFLFFLFNWKKKIESTTVLLVDSTSCSAWIKVLFHAAIRSSRRKNIWDFTRPQSDAATIGVKLKNFIYTTSLHEQLNWSLQ